ncbi:hypothetical protein SDC9_162779 [bioreactor metagenome]|uniref:Uncharacterized protein n=1 Tax=bioreactor metagenome TaxID=1076179 RepID=A0A645FM13_9ZZZZ
MSIAITKPSHAPRDHVYMRAAPEAQNIRNSEALEKKFLREIRRAKTMGIRRTRY